MNSLLLSCLGTPRLTYADQPLTFRTRKSLALLIYLTVERGVHSREKLVTLFWPESDTPRGRGMLRTTLAYLNQALEGLDSSYLNIGTQTLGFDFNRDFELDLDSVAVALDAIRLQRAPAERAHVLIHLQKAVRCYRGDFLEGFSLDDAPEFDDWASLQREMWHSRMNLVFETLSQWQFESGDLPAALETATRWKGHDLFGEDAPQRLMHLHFAGGNRVAALEVYDAYAKMLEAEFGGKPAAEIRALAARIRASSPLQPARQEAAQSFTSANLSSADLTFVGRVEEFDRLTAAYRAAAHGQPQAVVLMGETGIGKTRLTAEFLHWAIAQGADILAGRCFETGGEVPYQPLAPLLRQRMDQEGTPTDLLSVTWLAELSRLLPELRDRLPNLPQPQANETTAQSSLLESIARLGEALAERAPLILFIDDIQWADVPSLDALQYAMLRWTEHQSPILLLLCSRELSSTEHSNVRQWLASLKTKVAVTQIKLTPLTVEDTSTLISSLILSPVDRGAATDPERSHSGEERGLSPEMVSQPQFKALAQALFDGTGGQPLYLVETIKILLEQKMLVRYDAGEGVQELGESNDQVSLSRIIPNSVREAIVERLTRLTPTAVALLTAAAVLGQAATFGQLVEMSGIEQMAALDALEELGAKGLLLDSRHGDLTYVIAHDKIRDVVYGEASAARRHVLHGRAVMAMKGSAPARLAYHALAAGMDAEAFHYSVAAGDAALHLFAASEAATHYETARKLLATGKLSDVGPGAEPGAEVETFQHLYSNLGRALELQAQFDQAGALYEELKSIARQRAAPTLMLVALTAQLTLWSMISQSLNLLEGEALAQEALHLARQLGDPVTEAKILWALMNLHLAAGRAPEALVCGDQALALARQLNLRERMAFILNDMIKCQLLMGRLDLAGQAQQEASELWRELNNLPMLADSLAGSADIARWVGNYDAALTLSDEAYNLNLSIANIWGQSYSILATGYVYWERGQPDRAIAVMEECIQLAEQANYLMPQIFTRTDLGALYATLGDSQRGIETIQVALNIANTRLPVFRPYTIGMLAHVCVQQNLLDEAEALIKQAKEASNQLPFSFIHHWLYFAEAELAFSQAFFTETLALTEAIQIAIAQSGIRFLLPAILYLRGRCFIELGQQERAREALLEARVEAERMQSRQMLAQILPALASIESDRIQAADLLQQAEEFKAYIAEHTPAEVRATAQSGHSFI